MKNINKIKSKNISGQALLIVVVFMGAVMLGISVIAGYLFTQRLRTSVSITRSTQAIFAADAGIESQLYSIFADGGYFKFPTSTPKDDASMKTSGGVLGGASFETSREYNPLNRGFVIISLGTNGVERQLRLDLANVFSEELN